MTAGGATVAGTNVSVASEDRSPAAGRARAGLAVSLATFAMAASSGIQAVLYLGHFAVNARTDGFFVAFAVYATAGVFSQSLRLTAVPLLVGPGARLAGREFAAVLVLLAVPVIILTGPLAGPVSHLLAPGLPPAGRAETARALPVLGLAIVLQVWAAGGATLLAIRDRFAAVAGAYVAGAGAGLLAFLALSAEAGVQTLGWSMLVMAAVTGAWMLLGVRGSGGLGPRPARAPARRVLANAGLIVGSTPVYLAFNMLFVVTLAFASGATAGNTTLLSYAYLFASYLVAGTGMALGMSRIPEMTRQTDERRGALIAETVPTGFRYAMMIVAPALGGLIAGGAPLIHAVLPGSLTSAGVHALRLFAALLVPWTVAALVVSFLLAALFAARRARLLGLLVVPLVVVHLAVTALARSWLGDDGAVAAMGLAPLVLAVILLRAGAGARAPALARELARDALCFTVLAALAFGSGWAAGSQMPGVAGSATALAVGAALYAGGLRLVAQRQLIFLRSALAASSRA